MKHNEQGGNVEIFTEESIITLYDEQNSPYEFFEIASIEYEGKFYELLQPVESVEGIEEDEAVIFEYAVDEASGEKLFKPIFDQKLLESVFSLYIAAAADYESTACGCGSCGHESGCGHTHSHQDCDCGCGHDHDDTSAGQKPAAEEKPAKKNKK